MNHPIQPTELDEHGKLRFKPNKIVQYLLYECGIDRSVLTWQDFDNNEWEQFNQLIGYSVDGWDGLHHTSPETSLAVHAMIDGHDERDAKIAELEQLLNTTRSIIRNNIMEIVPELFNINIDDLFEQWENL